MSVIILQKDQTLTKEDLEKAREEYDSYIKFTVDLETEAVALGGEYHADAEKILLQNGKSESKNIVGGGYNITKDLILTNAMLNIRPNYGNLSPEILDTEKRERFLKIAGEIVSKIKSLNE